jgi:hypothetical protein
MKSTSTHPRNFFSLNECVMSHHRSKTAKADTLFPLTRCPCCRILPCNRSHRLCMPARLLFVRQVLYFKLLYCGMFTLNSAFDVVSEPTRVSLIQSERLSVSNSRSHEVAWFLQSHTDSTDSTNCYRPISLPRIVRLQCLNLESMQQDRLQP